MIPPDTTPFAPRRNDRCSDCESPLEPGQRWRCRPCIEAACRAVEAAGPGRVVRPPDVAGHKEG